MNRRRSKLTARLWRFSSQWFLIPQGTGIVAIILHQLKYQFHGLETISEIVWVYTIVLLSVFILLYMLRVCVYPRHVAAEYRTNIAETSCLASIGIALTTITQMIALTLVKQWGPSWGIVAYVFWWIVTSMAVVSLHLITYVHVKVQPPGVTDMSPQMLLPLIAALTSAAAGGTLCVYGALSPALQGPILVVAYLEIGAALPLAICMVGIFQSRLINRGFPSIEHVCEDMILCGPFGQGSFALLIAGRAIQNNVSSANVSQYNLGDFLTAQSAGALGTASEFAGLLVWGCATFWWVYGVIGIVHTLAVQMYRTETRQGLRFSMGAWSLVFPMGVYTNATVQLGQLMHSPAFNVWSTILLIMLLLIWIANHVFTIKGLITGSLLGPEALGLKQERSAV
ncbi:hypothetical protein UA08_08779 [Talaromyces atroroseus]|uniref:Sulfite efflux pump SSU1 n=1 Tax=Talaromyces atroroseus TaxID=1441469 RepID=A0A225A881_TALAT|nr:hypothetical protein UA08_08779 [Talaromyces atroroseus]OKL56090.1 hypothetical protein UA08_08779 [Talaromyces atroroseus]